MKQASLLRVPQSLRDGGLVSWHEEPADLLNNLPSVESTPDSVQVTCLGLGPIATPGAAVLPWASLPSMRSPRVLSVKWSAGRKTKSKDIEECDHQKQSIKYFQYYLYDFPIF